MKANILLVDDDLSIVKSVKNFLSSKNFNVETSTTGKAALEKFRFTHFDLLIIDLYLPDINGEEVVRVVKNQAPETIIIVITASGTIQSAINLFKMGISDYILKPFELEELFFVIEKHLESKKLKEENINLKKNLIEFYKPESLIGESKAMKEIYQKIVGVSHYDVNVLIEGESGVGKEVVARSIHFLSLRNNKPFYAINCGAIPVELLESEFFGYKKGAFTGAYYDKKGIFEEASGSTLFLDEINELPLQLQPKILRTLQEGTIKRIGENEERKIDVRIIAASSKNLQQEVLQKRFREDLFYRLNVFTIRIPPLRERKEDIPLLIDYFIKKYSAKFKKDIKFITKDALKKCMNYQWPGNVRELENTIQRAIILAKGESIDEEAIIIEKVEFKEDEFLKFKIDFETDNYREALKNSIDNVTRIFIKKALEKTNYNKLKAAKLLGISARALHYKIKKLLPELKNR